MNLSCPSEVWTESTIFMAGIVLAALLWAIGRMCLAIALTYRNIQLAETQIKQRLDKRSESVVQ